MLSSRLTSIGLLLALTFTAAAITVARAEPPPAERGEAVFAGGCFWCMETAFEGQPGVKEVISGYAGGAKKSPTYEEVGGGGTGHAESVRVVYDPTKTSYAKLLDIFWHNVDPFSAGGQFCDRGSQYRSAIFPLDDNQRRAAEASKRDVEKRLGRPVVTAIEGLGAGFFPAEEYHQDFYKKDPVRYRTYRAGCGRDRRLKDVWGAAPQTAH
jgi:peptide-methionine (S)-S-oxide reductase